MSGSSRPSGCSAELIHQGADPSRVNQNQRTAVDLAKEKDDEMMVRFLEAHASSQTLKQSIQAMETASLVRSLDVTDRMSAKKIRL